MTTIWVHSPSVLIATALGQLPTSLGYKVQHEPSPTADMALFDLCSHTRPYPPAPPGPTVAMICKGKGDPDLETLLLLGYRGFLTSTEGSQSLITSLGGFKAG